ncbi:MAG TPA: MarR family transcriptional regulator [Oleiagrimonas sp.]|nr:MarR family transcriptional regulator [Oleiagrimonas sp.]
MQTGIQRVAESIPAMSQTDVVLVRLLMMSGVVVNDELEYLLRPHRLNESEFRTLAILFSSPDGRAYPGELCQYATQKPTNMTRIIDTLVERDLVTRSRSAQDRRRVVLQITPQGRRFTRQLLPMLFPYVDATFKGFSADEKQQLDRLLRKLIHNLDSMLAARGGVA